MAATLHESAQDARVEREQSDGTCGCRGDDFMAEGSGALLDRLDRVMKNQFDAKMLGRVGLGHLTGVKFLKRTLRSHEQEMCFSWSSP